MLVHLKNYREREWVNSDGSVTDGGTTSMSGYTIVETESIESAPEMAKACPFLEIGGSLEVSKLMKMPF